MELDAFLARIEKKAVHAENGREFGRFCVGLSKWYAYVDYSYTVFFLKFKRFSAAIWEEFNEKS